MKFSANASNSFISVDAQEHPISSVRISKRVNVAEEGDEDGEFVSVANVTREISVELEPGDNEIEIINLPGTLEADSIHLSSGSDAFISDVSCSIVDPASKSPDVKTRELEKEIRSLEATRFILQGESRVLDHQAEILVSYGRSLTGAHVQPSAMESFMADFLEQGKANIERLATLALQSDELEEQLQKKRESAHEQVSDEFKSVKISATVFVKDAGPINFTLSYVTPQVKWKPIYEVRLSLNDETPSPTVSLYHRAIITQNTGEDWKGVSVVLTTDQSNHITSIPDLPPLKLHAILTPSSDTSAPTKTDALSPAQSLQQKIERQQAATAAKIQQLRDLVDGSSQEAPLSSAPSSPPTSPVPYPLSSAFTRYGNHVFGRPTPLPFASSSASFVPPDALLKPVEVPAGDSSSSRLSLLRNSSLLKDLPPIKREEVQEDENEGAQEDVREEAREDVREEAQEDVREEARDDTREEAVGAQGLKEEPREQDAPGPSHPPPPRAKAESEAPPVSEYRSQTQPSEPSAAATYPVVGYVTITSDNSPHYVSIDKYTVHAEIRHVVVPRVSNKAYIEYAITNRTKQPMLAGDVKIYVNGGYISTACIDTVNPGETFHCTAAQTSSLQVSHTQSHIVSHMPASTSLLDYTTSYTSSISLLNNTSSFIDHILVRDIVPTSDDDRIRIKITEPSSLASLSETVLREVPGVALIRWLNKKEGKVEWVRWVEPNEEVKLQLKWDVVAPISVKYSF
ncbi:hypothetical protein SISNIDRAFT_486956 [Sistotremastrum niveocremeum HHB9708]|uniref:Mucoidy inhibitor A n=1 Tax=Sistotremastrum niveocremeum HHB9708 TaxID=1314777 RepID=A0A164T2F1_9AGAM|nr:hypothetical protein SISNIDRAFT_486956 [Sistotremastrum niveocremeum HHB9708]